MEILWHSFPDVKDLDTPYPVIWTHFRPVEAIAPHRSDRFYVGKKELMARFLVHGLGWFLSFEKYTGELDRWFRHVCLPRRGAAAWTCGNTLLQDEDWLENFFIQGEFPIRMHEGICFNLRATRHMRACGKKIIENNCESEASPIHPTKVHVPFPTERDREGERSTFPADDAPDLVQLVQPYTREHTYDSLLAIQLHRLVNIESLKAGRRIRFIDVGAGIGTYVQSLGRMHPHIWGMDKRKDFNSLIGEQALFHDFRWPLPSIFRQYFDWACSINVLDSLNGSSEAIRSWAVTMDGLVRHGLVIHLPMQHTNLLSFFRERGFARDPELEVRIRAGSGLLCCRQIIKNTYVLRRTSEQLVMPGYRRPATACTTCDRGVSFSEHIYPDFTEQCNRACER
jgi:hypothetical protein